MALPLLFSATVSGTTLSLLVKADPAITDPIGSFDVDIGFMTSLATYVSTTQGPGYTALGNQLSPTTVRGTGFAQDGTGATGGPLLATLTFTLKSAVSSFPLTLTGVDVNGGAFQSGTANPTVAPCFAEGTRILTAHGEIAVEALVVGQAIVTLDGTLRPVQWIGHRRVACGLHPAPHDVQPVRIEPGAFGRGLPTRALVLSPDHSVFVDGALVPVRYLLNGATITQEQRSEVTYYHVELDQHAVVFADGLPAESYLDSGNRAEFGESTHSVIVPLPGHALAVWQNAACAKLLTDGPALAVLKERLLGIARALGHDLVTDPALHVMADGRRVDGVQDGAEYRFDLPSGAREIRLMSRTMVPAHMVGSSGDTRLLGIAVLSLTVDGTVQTGAGAGWYAAEDGLQWTDGAATLPSARSIAVTVAELGGYWLNQAITARLSQAA